MYQYLNQKGEKMSDIPAPEAALSTTKACKNKPWRTGKKIQCQQKRRAHNIKGSMLDLDDNY